LTIRGLDEETHARLRVRAAQHGQSMEAEVREILRIGDDSEVGVRGETTKPRLRA
jgi:antitoxin FitA